MQQEPDFAPLSANIPDNAPTSEGGFNPSVVRTPTLGRTVRLGELYNQCTGAFLGVQLYSESRDENGTVVETQINHTNLTLTPSTTLEDRASLLGIDPKLSLEILTGLVEVSASASYIKDVRSNTREQAFALALKVKLREERILFAERGMGRNTLNVAREDYIQNDSATHFVSSIVYGGNIIVNLVARQSTLSKNERLQGRLKAQLDKLKGAINIKGIVEEDIKNRFSGMDNKFDLITHCDVALEQVPINPKDLLDTIPKAASLINHDGGIPISVCLQPIPEVLKPDGEVYGLDLFFADQIQRAFSQLDDLRSRFSVLVDNAKSVEEFVPELARVARAAAVRYTEEHGVLLHQLWNFLCDFQCGEIGLQSDGPFKSSKLEDGSYDIPVLTVAGNLHRRHLKPDEEEDAEKGPSSRHYSSTLVGLENELVRFQHFVADIQKSRDSITSLDEDSKESICLGNIDEICRAIGLQDRIPLFVMTPFGSKSAKLKPDLAIIQLLAIVRENVAYFNDPSTPAHILYVEDLEDLECRLPSDGKFSQLACPTLFFGRVDVKGKLTWSGTPTTTPVSSRTVPSNKEFTLKLYHKSSEKSGEVSHRVDGMNASQSFSFQIRAKRTGSGRQAPGWTICVLRHAGTKQKFLSFDVPFRVLIHHDPNDLVPVSVDACDAPPVDTLFVATIVQNVEARKWVLYLDDKVVGTETIVNPRKLAQQPTSVELYYPSEMYWWRGEVYEVKAFPCALTEEQVAAEAKKGRDATN